MAFIADVIFDSGLSYATTNGTRMDICSSEPTTYAAATSTASLGNATITTGAPENGAVNGRRVQTSAITAGSVTGTGTATHYALTNGSNELLATGTISSQGVTSGNTFTLGAVSLTLSDAVAA